MSKWTNVTTKLRDLDPHRLHYVKLPDVHHIVIDFDLKDESGFKSFEKNLVAASKWPKTYAETSKSGKGIHLHYIYSGDPTKLSRIYDDNIEVKVYTGNASLRRMLTKCNDLPIATISSGLPLKGDDKMLDMNVVTTEKVSERQSSEILQKKFIRIQRPRFNTLSTFLIRHTLRGCTMM